MGVFLVGFGRMGVGERSSCCSAGACDCTLPALRMAPSLAASDAVCGFLSGDLDTARRAAICSGAGDKEGTGFRPRLTAPAGESELVAFSLPILSFTEPTSGPGSDSASIRRGSAWRFPLVLARAAAVAADSWGFTWGVVRGVWLKAIAAPCCAAESECSRIVKRWVEPAISPFMA